MGYAQICQPEARLVAGSVALPDLRARLKEVSAQLKEATAERMQAAAELQEASAERKVAAAEPKVAAAELQEVKKQLEKISAAIIPLFTKHIEHLASTVIARMVLPEPTEVHAGALAQRAASGKPGHRLLEEANLREFMDEAGLTGISPQEWLQMLDARRMLRNARAHLKDAELQAAVVETRANPWYPECSRHVAPGIIVLLEKYELAARMLFRRKL